MPHYRVYIDFIENYAFEVEADDADVAIRKAWEEWEQGDVDNNVFDGSARTVDVIKLTEQSPDEPTDSSE